MSISESFNNIAEGASNLANAGTNAKNAVESLNTSVLKSGAGLSALEKSLKDTGAALTSVSSGLEKISGGLGLDVLKNTFGIIGDLGKSLTTFTTSISSIFTETIRVTDSLTAVNRNLVAENFKLFAQFGEGIETVEAFSNSMLQNAETLAKSEMGYQNFATESRKVVETLMQQKISFEQLQEPIKTNIGDFNLYNSAILQSQALGLDLSSYAKLLSDAMIFQGKSAQEATQILSLYGEISSDTGLTINTVSTSLNGLANSFRKMGLDANFGESFLRGFVSTLKETNIGIENAADLAQTFGNRLANLSTNYSSAFVTSMRGGLDMGSGGALGAGIQMQARMMSRDEDQGQLGKDIAEAVRDTVASFSGGQIVTVQQAAESRDPRLEQIYYTQTQLLGTLYGITDTTEAARVLELLEQMSEAEVTGDAQLMESVGKNIEDALGLREKTLSNEEKLNSLATAQLAELSLQTQLMTGVLSALVKETAGETIEMAIRNGNNEIQKFLKDNSKSFEDAAEKVKTGESKTIYEALTGSGLSVDKMDDLLKSAMSADEAAAATASERSNLTNLSLNETLLLLNNTLQKLLMSTGLAGAVGS